MANPCCAGDGALASLVLSGRDRSGAVADGGRFGMPVAGSTTRAPLATSSRVLSIVLALELVWLLLVATSIVFLAAHLGAGTDEITGSPSSRRMLLIVVPPLTVALGLALIVARHAVDRRAASPDALLNRRQRLSLCVTALANGAVVLSIAISLYHAHTTWLVV